jgi:hypothetical protein
VRWCAWLHPGLESLDDDHVSAAAGARRTSIERLFLHVVIERLRDGEQLADAGKAGLARRTGEQAVMANAVEPGRQDVKQEAADELVDAERHDLLAVRAIGLRRSWPYTWSHRLAPRALYGSPYCWTF